MRSVLMIAFHYPPAFGSSGIHRTLQFSRYLPKYGWQPTVLTVNASVHAETKSGAIPGDVDVQRTFALDTARNLSLSGRYPRWLALPDRWISWWGPAVVRGLKLVRRKRPDAIWSTCPIATAHLIGLTLQRLTRIPWIADFRDPMTERDPATGIEYPLDPHVRRVTGWIERPTVRHCARAVFTTPGTTSMYAQRFPEFPQSKWAMIANGYDEEEFRAAEAQAGETVHGHDRPLVFVHSGVLYPDVRNPRAFFAALGDLRRRGRIDAGSLNVVLRASGSNDYYKSLITQHGLEDLVVLAPGVPHREALVEMLRADGLLIFQAASCNWQIPAKLYECLRARRPILALTDVAGDTANVLLAAGIDTIVALDDAKKIAAAIEDFVARVRANRAPTARPEAVSRHTRESRTAELAEVLDQVVDE